MAPQDRGIQRMEITRVILSKIGDDRRLREDRKRVDEIISFTAYKVWVGDLYLCTRQSHIKRPHCHQIEDQREAVKLVELNRSL